MSKRPLLAFFAASLCVTTALSQKPNSQSAKPVVVATVIEAEVKSGHRVVGTVMPSRTSTIGSAVDGRVKEFLVNQGDPVKEGQVLAKLRTKTLEIQEAVAEAELKLAKEQFNELKNGSRPEEVDEAEAKALGAAASLKHTTAKLRRIEALITQKAASKTDLDDAREKADVAQYALKASEALFRQIKAGPRAEIIAQAEAQVELQQQKLNLIVDQIDKFTIKAPFDGFISSEFTEVGAWISRGDPIVEVIEMAEIEIQAPVTAEAAVNLTLGDTVRVEFPELPNELVTGSIKRIVPIGTTRARTFPIHINVKNKFRDKTPLLLAGMLARVDLPSGRSQKLMLAPKDALVLNGRDRAVYVVDQDPKSDATGNVRKVSVDLGVAAEGLIEIRGNIQPGDLVVVVGNERLLPNAKVRIDENQSAGKSQ